MSDYVPEEVIDEIFARLPSKSLLRLRSLSKSWYSLIGSSDFIQKHASLSPQKVLVKYGDHRGEDLDALHSVDRVLFHKAPDYLKMISKRICGHSLEFIGSSNGLLCFFNDSIITLWNPSIRRELTLPYNSRWGGKIFGFGYDRFSDDYKIVNLLHSKWTMNVAQNSYVYSIKEGVWRPIVVPATSIFSVITSSWGCLVKGVLHWMVMEHQSHRYILTFDLSTEVFGMITLPDPSYASRELTTINGSLAVVSTDDYYSLIWVRKECNNVSSWSIFHKFEGWNCNILPLANGNFLSKSSSGQFVVHNPTTMVKSWLINSKDHYWYEMVPYVETLVLMDKGAPCNEFQPYSSSFQRIHVS